MRTVLGVVVAVVLAVGCGGEPDPIEPMCADDGARAGCVEGMVATCDETLTQVAFVSDTQCVGLGVLEGETDRPRCDGDMPVCDSGADVVCVEAPSSAPADCARWAAACAEMGLTSCYVPAGTDDVFPY